MLLSFSSTGIAKEKIVILQPDTEDGSASEVKALQTALIEDWKEREEYQVLPSPEAEVLDLAFDAECIDTDDECFTTIGKTLGADYVVYAVLAGGDASVRVIDVNKGQESAAFVAAGGAAGVGAAMVGAYGAKPAPPAPPAPAPKPVVKAEAPKKELPIATPKKEKKEELPDVELSVITTPADAFVYLNNKRVGKSPVTIKQPGGTYTVRILKPGFADSVREVKLSKAPVKLNVNLSDEGGAAAPVAVVAPTGGSASPVGGDDDEKFYETWWFWTSVGVAAVGLGLGITAAAGGFDEEASETGDLNFVFDNGAEKDFRVQALRR